MLGIFPAPKAAAGAAKNPSMRREAMTRDAILNGRFAILRERCRQKLLDYQAVAVKSQRARSHTLVSPEIVSNRELNGEAELVLIV